MKLSFHRAVSRDKRAFLIAALLATTVSAKAELTEAQIQQIKEHHALKLSLRSENRIIPVTAMPEGLSWDEGKLTLVADPEDRSYGKMALYVVNATSEEVPSTFFFTQAAFKEAKIGGRWERSEEQEAGCYSPIFHPALPPGHAALLEAGDTSKGDVDGEVRLCLTMSPILATKPFRGRFFVEEIHIARRDDMAVHLGWKDFDSGLEKGKWEECPVARSPEEFWGELELIRAYDESWALKDCLLRWEKERQETPGSFDRLDQIRSFVYSPPSGRHQDERRCFQLCLLSLSSPQESDEPYGLRKRPHAMVWRFLVQGPGPTYLPNPEREAELQAIEASGNPWKAEAKDLERLVVLATQEVMEGKDDEAEAAFNFLRQKWAPVSDGMIQCFSRVAEGQSKVEAIRGLEGLVAIGHGDAAVEIAKRRGLEMPRKKDTGK